MCLRAVAYFSDSGRSEGADVGGGGREERHVGEIEVERGDEDGGFISM